MRCISLQDGLKSFFKEDFIPQGADRFLFTIAPYFGFAAGMATFAIIPFAGPIGDFTFQITDVETRSPLYLRNHFARRLWFRFGRRELQ